MTLAFEAENPNLIRHLGAQLGSGMKAYGDQMITLFEQPAKAMNTAYFTTAAPSKSCCCWGWPAMPTSSRKRCWVNSAICARVLR